MYDNMYMGTCGGICTFCICVYNVVLYKICGCVLMCMYGSFVVECVHACGIDEWEHVLFGFCQLHTNLDISRKRAS